jgi:hypothetical protein
VKLRTTVDTKNQTYINERMYQQDSNYLGDRLKQFRCTQMLEKQVIIFSCLRISDKQEILKTAKKTLDSFITKTRYCLKNNISC